MNQSVTIKGVDEVIAKLEEKFSKRKLTQIENSALKIGGRYYAASLKNAVSGYKDTGATMREVVVGKPKLDRGGVRDVKIGWAGDGTMQRWRLVHLNEFGYVRNKVEVTPRGFGKIQEAYESGKTQAMALQAKQLRKLVD